MRLPVFYGWIIVAVTFVSMGIGVNARTAFSLLFPPILDEFHWDRGVTAGAFSFGFVVSAAVSPLIGRLMDRAGPRAVMELGVALMAGGLLLAPLTTQPWHLYLTIGVMVGAGSICLGYSGQSLFLPNWFNRRRGLAMGLAFAGVGIGSTKFELGLLSRDGGLARQWLVWLAASVLSYSCIVVLLYVKHNDVADMNHLPLWWRLAHTTAFVCFSAAQTFSLLALFLRFDSKGTSLLDPLRESAFGIYLIHYVPVLWLQYALFGASLAPAEQETAVLKALIAFVLTLAISWAATAALRKIPGATRVL